MQFPPARILVILGLLSVVSCNRQYSVSINNQPVFNPNTGSVGYAVRDADLQGCFNLALRQQNTNDPLALQTLSCAGAEVEDLTGIGRFARLRFVDLGRNRIGDLTPLANLSQLAGLNLPGNQISDISTLLTMPALTAVNLADNPRIPCSQLDVLQQRLGESLIRSSPCRN